MKKGFRIGYFEAVCALGTLTTMVAYTISDFHFTLTLLLVIVLGIVALIHDSSRGTKASDSDQGNRAGNPEPVNPAPRLVHTRRATLASTDRQHPSK